MAAPIYSGTQNNTPNTTHTMGNFESYTGKAGQIFLAASFWVPPAANATGLTLVRNAAGSFSWHVAASITGKLFCDLGLVLRQLLLQAVPSQVGKPYTVANANTVGTGLAIQSVQPIFGIAAVNLATAPTLIVTQAVMPADNAAAAPVVTNLLAATNLSTAFRANLYNTKINVTNQAMLTTALAAISAELDVTTPAGGTFDFYGMYVNLNYAY